MFLQSQTFIELNQLAKGGIREQQTAIEPEEDLAARRSLQKSGGLQTS